MCRRNVNFLIVFFGLSFFLLPFLMESPAYGLSSGQIASNAPVFLREIKLQKTSDSLEVEILCDRYSSHRKMELSNPNKIVIDFLDIDNIRASRRIQVDAFGIQAIRAGMFKSNMARVVFDLEGKIPVYRIERIPEGAKIIFPATSDPATPPIERPAEMKTPRGTSVSLREINLNKTQDFLEVEILCDIYSAYRYSYHNRTDSIDPNKIVIDFLDINEVRASRITQVNDFGILAIRVNMVEPDVARVVFDLEDVVPNYSIEKVQKGLKISFLEPSVSTVITIPSTTTTTTTTTSPTTTISTTLLTPTTTSPTTTTSITLLTPTTTSPTTTTSITLLTPTTSPTTTTSITLLTPTTTFPTTTTSTSTTSSTTTTTTSTVTTTTTTTTTTIFSSTTTTTTITSTTTTTTTSPSTTTTTTIFSSTTTTTTSPSTTTTTTITSTTTTTTISPSTTTTTTITSTTTTTTTTTTSSTTTTMATLPPPPPPPTSTLPSFETEVTALKDSRYPRDM